MYARKAASKTPRRKVFASVEHLSAQAVAAFVDGELSAGATHRAKVHLVHCPECRADVAAQRRAAQALRQAEDDRLCAPSALVAKLTNIADHVREDTPGESPSRRVGQVESVAKILTILRRARR